MAAKTASDVRENWGETLDGVLYRGDRVVITKSGKPAAALVSTEDLALLELIEDRIDIELIREARSESDERIGNRLRGQLHRAGKYGDRER